MEMDYPYPAVHFDSQLIVPNSSNKIRIGVLGIRKCALLRDIAQAIGYSSFNAKESSISTAAKKVGVRFKKCRAKYTNCYVIYIEDIVPVLSELMEILIRQRDKTIQPTTAERIMFTTGVSNCQKLILLFKQKNLSPINLPHSKEDILITSDIREESQMEFKPLDNKNVVQDITIQDFDNIAERANAIAKTYGVALKDALRAATKLKEQEIGRDLTPLIELLA